MALIRQLPSCLLGSDPPNDPHHLRIKAERGMGMRATDRWAIPLSRYEHNLCHCIGSKHEEAWFRSKGVNAIRLANELWEATGDLEAMTLIVAKYLKIRLRFIRAQRAAKMRAERGDNV